MKNYYKILEIDNFSDSETIKKSFRRLAMTYHPDKNPSEKAHQIFIEINEAYEILSDPRKKQEYDQRLKYYLLTGIEQTTRPYSQNYNYTQRRRYKAYYRYKQKKKQKPEYTEKEIAISRTIIIASFILSIIFISDYFILPQHINQKIIYINQPFLDEEVSIIKSEKFKIPVKTSESENHFRIGDTITFVVTNSLKNVKAIYKTESDKKIYLKPAYGIFGSFSFFLIAIFSVSLLGLYEKDKYLIVSTAIVNSLLIIIITFFLVF